MREEIEARLSIYRDRLRAQRAVIANLRHELAEREEAAHELQGAVALCEELLALPSTSNEEDTPEAQNGLQ